jgi:hypothetical protein
MDAREFQFVFAGFCAAWIIVVVYAITLTFRDRRLRQELDRVRKMLEKAKSVFLTRGKQIRWLFDRDSVSAPELRITRRERALEEKHECRLCHLTMG